MNTFKFNPKLEISYLQTSYSLGANTIIFFSFILVFFLPILFYLFSPFIYLLLFFFFLGGGCDDFFIHTPLNKRNFVYSFMNSKKPCESFCLNHQYFEKIAKI